MTDLINGLGGPAGFGEQRGPVRDDDVVGPIDLSSVFADGLTIQGETYTQLFIGENGSVGIGNPDDELYAFPASIPEFFLFDKDHFAEGGESFVTPGGTSQGTNTIYYDLDPEAGAVTVTWDDVEAYFGENDERNAYQIRFLDLPGGSQSFAVEYRYEAIEWGAANFPLVGFNLGDPLGDFGFGSNFYEFVDTSSPEAVRDLTETGVIRFEFGSDSITSNLPGQEDIPIYGAPIEGTDGRDFINGTDGADVILGGRGRDTIRPGEGADVIALFDGAKTIRGTVDELLGDTLRGPIENDRLLFEGVAFDRSAVSFVDVDAGFSFDIDGDGTAEGEIATDLFTFPERSVLTATTAQGTYVTTVVSLPEPDDFFFRPRDYDFDLNTRAYLRGDGQSDFALRLDGLSTTGSDGTALGIYLYDRDGTISDVQLLTTDVTAAGEAEFLIEDVARGENIGVFVLTPDEAVALDDFDSFAFVDETGGEASFDDLSYIFAEVDGEIISADLLHVANRRLNVDQQQHALVGMTERAGLTIAIEEELYAARGDFDDVVLSIERLAVDLM